MGNRSDLYAGRWRKARLTFLAREPLCRACAKRGRTTAATEVDHETPHKGDQALFWDTSNWQPLCKPCHSAKTAREDGGFGNAQGKEAGCDVDGNPIAGWRA